MHRGSRRLLRLSRHGPDKPNNGHAEVDHQYRLMVKKMVAALVIGLLGVAAAAQGTFTREELAGYRLTAPLFDTFEDASNGVAAVVRKDARYTAAPLFTREIIQADDVVAAATELHRRLNDDPALAAAVTTAGMTTREFTVFSIALIGARVAQGFVDAGILRRVPAGVPSDNVAFVRDRHREITTVLITLGIRM